MECSFPTCYLNPTLLHSRTRNPSCVWLRPKPLVTTGRMEEVTFELVWVARIGWSVTEFEDCLVAAIGPK